MKSTYRLAGHTIKIESLYSQVNTLCAAYRVEDNAEYCITTTPAFEELRAEYKEYLLKSMQKNYHAWLKKEQIGEEEPHPDC